MDTEKFKTLDVCARCGRILRKNPQLFYEAMEPVKTLGSTCIVKWKNGDRAPTRKRRVK